MSHLVFVTGRRHVVVRSVRIRCEDDVQATTWPVEPENRRVACTMRDDLLADARLRVDHNIYWIHVSDSFNEFFEPDDH
ncbi:MAG: hypothetical protein KDB50_11240 [Mycobacterium sp.]|nr:hypothetical protein [Mycobacterium sp.]